MVEMSVAPWEAKLVESMDDLLGSMLAESMAQKWAVQREWMSGCTMAVLMAVLTVAK